MWSWGRGKSTNQQWSTLINGRNGSSKKIRLPLTASWWALLALARPYGS